MWPVMALSSLCTCYELWPHCDPSPSSHYKLVVLKQDDIDSTTILSDNLVGACTTWHNTPVFPERFLSEDDSFHALCISYCPTTLVANNSSKYGTLDMEHNRNCPIITSLGATELNYYTCRVGRWCERCHWRWPWAHQPALGMPESMDTSLIVKKKQYVYEDPMPCWTRALITSSSCGYSPLRMWVCPAVHTIPGTYCTDSIYISPWCTYTSCVSGNSCTCSLNIWSAMFICFGVQGDIRRMIRVHILY